VSRHHLLAGDLERFVQGTLSCPGRRRVIAHLVHGCPDCGAALASYADFPPYAAAPPEAADDEAFGRALARARRVAETRLEAVAVLESLVAGESPGAALPEAARDRRRGVARIAALLHSSRAHRHDDPARMLGFAYKACETAGRLSTGAYGARTVADFRALTWAELGNSYRVVDDLQRAGRALDGALYWVRRGSRTPLLEARLLDLFASLFVDRRRFADARELLSATHDIYAAAGELHLAGRTLIKAGHLASTAGEPGEAIVLSHRGLDLIDHRRDPQLAAQTLRNMIDCLVRLGHFRAARRQLFRVRALLTADAHRLDLLRLRWLEAKIYAGVGNFDRAETAFEETRSGFVEARQIYPAALVALDLAALWARQGRNREIGEIAGDLVAIFRALGIAREAIATLLVLQRACEIQGRVAELVEAASAVLREIQHRPVRVPPA
jgi:tetratricopeptide (TPR) repeat protein